MKQQTYTFPDGRQCTVFNVKERPVEQWKKTAQEEQITKLLAVGVSQKLIAQHLHIRLLRVARVCRRWKREELPKILQKRAQQACKTS
jgi:hypothetical protein